MEYDLKKRVEKDRILEQNRLLTERKLAEIVSEYADDFVGVLNSTRQFVITNNNYFHDGGESDCALGKRPGELFGCIHAWESDFGCGNSASCKYCDAVQTVVEAIGTNRRVTRDSRLLVENSGFSSMNVRTTAIPVEIEGEIFVLLFIKDISKEASAELLEKAFFHDVLNSSTTLQSLISISDVSSDAIPNADQTIQMSIRDIVEQIQYFQKLKLAESGSLNIEKEIVDLDEEIRLVCDGITAAPYSEGKELVLSLEAGGAGVLTDGVLYRRIVLNLVKNAMEASRPGDKVTVRLFIDEDTCRLEVSNPAVMSPEVKSQVFQRSFSTKGRGRGIGTYSIKMLGEKFLGGRIGFSSDNQNGTVFSFELPLYNE